MCPKVHPWPFPAQYRKSCIYLSFLYVFLESLISLTKDLVSFRFYILLPASASLCKTCHLLSHGNYCFPPEHANFSIKCWCSWSHSDPNYAEPFCVVAVPDSTPYVSLTGTQRTWSHFLAICPVK